MRGCSYVAKVALASVLAIELLGSAFGLAAGAGGAGGDGSKVPCNTTSRAQSATTANIVANTSNVPPPAGATCTAEAQTGGSQPPSSPDTPVTEKFGGLTFGVGLGLNFLAQKGVVSSASVVNGIVRATATDDTTASLVLESHYFFVPTVSFLGMTNVPKGTWGHGPFVAIVSSAGANNGDSSSGTASNVISAYALGWMIGFRVPTWVQDKSDPKTWDATYSGSASWNFGVGFSVNPNAQTLGDGIISNQSLPNGETSIRYKTQPLYGAILVSSFSF